MLVNSSYFLNSVVATTELRQFWILSALLSTSSMKLRATNGQLNEFVNMQKLALLLDRSHLESILQDDFAWNCQAICVRDNKSHVPGEL